MTEFSVFMPLHDIVPENSWLGRHFFYGIQSYMKNNNEGSESKIMLGNLNCIMSKMERNGRNKTVYRFCFNYVLSKLIVNNGLEDLWRRETPDSSKLTRYRRSSGTRFRINSVYTDVHVASNTKIN